MPHTERFTELVEQSLADPNVELAVFTPPLGKTT